MRRRWPWYLVAALMIIGTIGRVPPAGANNSDDGTGHGAIVRVFDAAFVECAVVFGDFRWSPSYMNILITGTLIDQPATEGSGAGCGELKTTVTFTAYAGSYVMSHTEQADDVRREFTASLSAPVAVDRIAVKLCRVPTSGGTSTCIPPVVYPQPRD